MPRSSFLISFYRLLVLALSISVGLAGCRSLDSIPFTSTPSPAPTTSKDLIAYGQLPTLPSTPVPAETEIQASPVQPTPLPALPKEHYITNIRGHRQYFSLGCEAATAKDWANYFQLANVLI